MATKAQWEVDPETRSKVGSATSVSWSFVEYLFEDGWLTMDRGHVQLAQIQKREGSGNDKCCDCGAPSPQWASPKFSTFICLTCAGLHRGLGVHVSFVRSISMDAFKQHEIARMQNGGNKKWQEFYNKIATGSTFEEATIKERYDCEVGEEWKERLTKTVEGEDFDKEKWRKEREEVLKKQRERVRERAETPLGRGSQAGSGRESPAPTQGKGITAEEKAKNEEYFAKMGQQNANRPEELPPSQGGKYGGFGSAVPEPQGAQQQGVPSADEFQKDPMAALTKGFGWFSAAVGKQAKMVNDSYIQPAAKNIASTDFAAQARNAALAAGQGIQSGAKGAADGFNKFIEGQDEGAAGAARKKQVEPEKKDFWDSFGVPAVEDKPSNIGTGVMKKTPSGGAGPQKRNKDDGWGDDW